MKRKQAVDLFVAMTHTPPASGWGGVIVSSTAFLKSLVQLGISIKVVSSDANGNGMPITETQARDATGLDISVFRCNSFKRNGVSLQAVLAIWRGVGTARAVYVPGIFTFPVTLAALFASIRRKPYIMHAHGGLLSVRLEELRRKSHVKWMFFKLVVEPLIKRAFALNTSSEFEAREVRIVAPQANIAITPNLRNLGEIPFNSASGNFRSGISLVFVGRIEHDKGILMFARIWSATARSSDQLSIVGQGSGPYYDEFVQFCATDERIILRGELDKNTTYMAIAASDALVLPSGLEGTLRENFGNVVVEALAIGRPVLVSSGLAWDALPKAGVGLLFDRDKKSVEEAIIQSRQYKSNRELAERCRKYAESQFDLNRMSNGSLEIVHIINKAIGRI